MVESAKDSRTAAQRGNIAVAAALGVALLGVATSVWLAWQPCAADGCVDAATEQADAKRSSTPGARVSDDPPSESLESTDAAGRGAAAPKARALRRQRDHVALLAPGEPAHVPLPISDPEQTAAPVEEAAAHVRNDVASADREPPPRAALVVTAPPTDDPPAEAASPLSDALADAATPAREATRTPEAAPATDELADAAPAAEELADAAPAADELADAAPAADELADAAPAADALADAAPAADELAEAAPAADALADAALAVEDGIADAAPPTAGGSDSSAVATERAAPDAPTPVDEAAGAAAPESSLADARLAAATAPPPPPDAAAALEATPQASRGPTDLSGWWDLNHAIDTTTYLPYLGLRMGYRVRLRQEGDKLVGTGERLSENGRVLPADERTPISLEGKVVGRSVTLRFTEQGSGGKSGGVINWQLAGDGERVDGIFASSAARSSGLSKARRVAGR